jgi:hypothetical protein
LGVVNSNVREKNEINGHEIPLAPLRNQPNAIQTLLGIGEDKLSRDYITKHHPEILPQATRGTYLTDITNSLNYGIDKK